MAKQGEKDRSVKELNGLLKEYGVTKPAVDKAVSVVKEKFAKKDLLQKQLDELIKTASKPAGQDQVRGYEDALKKARDGQKSAAAELQKEEDALRSEQRAEVTAKKKEVQRLAEKAELAKEKWSDLQAQLDSKRSRAIKRDGHFQVMDDRFNRDKMVKRYKELYNQIDIISVALENKLTSDLDLQEYVESRIGAYFADILKITFTQAQDLLERMLKSLTQAISGPGPEHDVVAKRELTSLLKELLRVSFKADHPRILTQRVLEKSKSHYFYKKMEADPKNKGDHHGPIEKFVEQCSDVVWHLCILPHTIRPEEKTKTPEFNPARHERTTNSNLTNQWVSEVLWPALMIHSDDSDKKEPVCLAKGLVATQDIESKEEDC